MSNPDKNLPEDLYIPEDDLDLDVSIASPAESLELDVELEFDIPTINPEPADIPEDLLDIELDIGLPNLDTNFSPFDDVYVVTDEEEDDIVEGVIGEEEEKLTPRQYLEELLENYITFRKDNPVKDNSYSSNLNKNIRTALVKIIRERGFDMKESTGISEILIESETSGNYDRSQIIRLFRERYTTDDNKLRSLNYSLENLKSLYKRMMEEERIKKERIQAPRKNLEAEFYYVLDEAARAFIMYFRDNQKTVSYFEDITFSSDKGYSFTCGNCGATHRIKSSPILGMVYPTDRKIKTIQKPLMCTCEALNIIRKTTFQSLESGIRSHYKANLDSWSDNNVKLSSILNFFHYEPKSSLLGSSDGKIRIESAEAREEVEERFESLKSRMNSKFFNTIKLAKNLDKIKYEEDSLNSLKVYSDLAKYLCILNKEKYSNLLRMAKGSLYSHIKESTLFFFALHEENPRIISLIESEKLFRKGNLDKKVLDRIANSLGVFGEYTLEDIEKGYEDLKEQVKSQEEDRQFILSHLDSMTKFFMFIPIKDFSYTNELDVICSDPMILNWVDRVTNLMVIVHLIPQVYNLWGNKQYGKGRNDSFFRDKKASWDARLKSFSLACKELGFYKGNILWDNLRGAHAFFSGDPLITESTNIKNAIRRVDYVTFLNRVRLITKAYSPVLSVMNPIFQPLTVEAHKFFLDFDNKDTDYYEFYYGDQFTTEEIREDSHDLSGERVAPVYKVKREEGERFKTYIQRIKNLNQDYQSLPASPYQKFFNEKTKLSFFLSALSALNAYREMHGSDDFKKYTFVCETILLFPRFNLDKIYSFLGIPTPSSDLIQNVQSEEDEPSKSRFLDELIESVIFESESLNALRDTYLEAKDLFLVVKEEEGLETLVDSLSYSERLGGLLS